MEAAERAARGPPTVRVRLDLPSLEAAQRYGGPPATKVRARIIVHKVKERPAAVAVAVPAAPDAADTGGGAGDAGIGGGSAEEEGAKQQADAAPAPAPAASNGAVALSELATAAPGSYGIVLHAGSARAFLPRGKR